MIRSENEKAKLILSWFKKHTYRIDADKKIIILNRWINMCSKKEEFMVADTLQKELTRIKHDLVVEKINTLCFCRVKIIQFLRYIYELWTEEWKSKKG